MRDVISGQIAAAREMRRLWKRPTAMELPLRVPKGHTGRVIVVISLDEGWDVSAEIDERVVPMRHCRDWHHVERFVTTIEAAFATDRSTTGVPLVPTD